MNIKVNNQIEVLIISCSFSTEIFEDTPERVVSLREYRERTSSQAKCLEFLEELQWDNRPLCPECCSFRISYISTRLIHKCRDCGKQFSSKSETIFKSAKLDLPACFGVLEEFCAQTPISIVVEKLLLSRQVVTNLYMKFRRAIHDNLPRPVLEGIVEIDEKQLGGEVGANLRKGLMKSKVNKLSKGMNGDVPSYLKYIDKMTILTFKEQNRGFVRAIYLGSQYKSATADAMARRIIENVAKESEIWLDEAPTHKKLDKLIAQKLRYVKHKQTTRTKDANGKIKVKTRKWFKSEDAIHTNGVERVNWSLQRFWNHYVHFTKMYVDDYLAEFELMMNSRLEENGFLALLNFMLAIISTNQYSLSAIRNETQNRQGFEDHVIMKWQRNETKNPKYRA